MKFTGKTDIEATLNATFAQFADFESFERFGLQSGADIRRKDDLTAPGPGMMWDLRMEYRGKPRRLDVELVDYDPPNNLNFTASSDAVNATILVELVPLSNRQTRAAVTLDVTPKSLAAKLAVQTARLTKGALNKKFKNRLNRFGKSLEDRINRA